jgi:hypothetical protein
MSFALLAVRMDSYLSGHLWVLQQGGWLHHRDGEAPLVSSKMAGKSSLNIHKKRGLILLHIIAKVSCILLILYLAFIAKVVFYSMDCFSVLLM